MAGGDFSGPTGDEGNAMAAFVKVGFVAAIAGAGVVAVLFEQFKVGFGRATVVAGEQEQGIAVNVVVFQCGEELADVVVGLDDEVGVRIEAADAAKRRNRHDGSMRRGQGEVEEEGRAVAGGGSAGLDVLNGFVEDVRQNLVDVKVGADGSFSIPAVAVLAFGNAFFTVGRGGDAPGIHPNIRRHIQRAAVGVVLMESVDVRAVFHWLGKVDFRIVCAVCRGFMPVPTKMPLANHGGMIAGGLEEMADCGAFGRDEVFASAVENAAGKPGTPVVASGEQSVASGSADGARCVCVQKGEAFVGHSLQVRRLNFAIGISGRDVPNAKVVGHHENDVGQIVGRRGNAKAGGKGDAGNQK